MHEFQVYPSNLRRHREGTNNRAKFTYVHVNLSFKPSQNQEKKVNKPINTGKVSFVL